MIYGDRLSDILAGTNRGGRAYIFFGSSTVASSAPSVVLSGATINFGNQVSQIGDIDNDGLPDIAVSDPIDGIRVYIYKGRTTWPSTLTAAQADYVITTDASYAGSLFGTSLAPLGDFTGDGVDDLAIGARNFGGGPGRVVIIPGRSGFAGVALPDATNSIVIDGDVSLGRPFSGYRVLGLGHFYSATSGTTLIVLAPGAASSATANMGRVYAFHGQTGMAGGIPVSAADHPFVGPASGARIGLALSNLGPMLGSSPAVGIGSPFDAVSFPE